MADGAKLAILAANMQPIRIQCLGERKIVIHDNERAVVFTELLASGSERVLGGRIEMFITPLLDSPTRF